MRKADVDTNVRITIFLLFSLSLLAQPPEGGRRGPDFMRIHPLLVALDADHDGAVTAQEWAKAPAALKSLDKDRDGKVQAEEMRPAFGPGGPGGRGERGPGGPGGEGPRANPSEMVDTLMAFDKNRDGALVKDEVPERMQGVFARGDANKDGKLTRDELSKLAAAPAPSGGGGGGGGRGEGRGPGGPGGMDPIMAALDSDRDGAVSAAEITGSAAALAKLDRNKDGKLSDDEVRPAFGPGGPGGPGGRGRGGRGGDPAEMAGHFFEEWDANGDGKLAKNELPERMRERFAEGDGNKDGWISRTELTALLQAGMGGGQR